MWLSAALDENLIPIAFQLWIDGRATSHKLPNCDAAPSTFRTNCENSRVQAKGEFMAGEKLSFR